MSPNESESIFGRQWQLIQLLSESPEGLTVDDLVAKTSCSKRTVRRNLALFRDYGIPLIEKTERHGLKRYRIALNSTVPAFSYDEVAAVYIGRRFLEPMMGTFFWKAMQSALDKMRNCIGTQMIRHLERSVGIIKHTPFGRADYSKRADMIDDLNFAIAEKRQTAILYQTLYDAEPSTTLVDPYGLAFHTGSLYLIGFSYKRNKIRHWKIDRMTGVTITNDNFHEPTDFDFEKHLDRLFGIFWGDTSKPSQLVRIHFDSRFVREIQENHWHESERYIDQPDGSVIMELYLGDLDFLKRWLLGFGCHAKVLEPPELREMIRQELRSSLEFYETL